METRGWKLLSLFGFLADAFVIVRFAVWDFKAGLALAALIAVTSAAVFARLKGGFRGLAAGLLSGLAFVLAWFVWIMWAWANHPGD